MRSSLQTRITIAFIGLAVVPLVLVGIILALRAYTVQQTQALDLQGEVARRVSAEVTTFIQEREKELRLISEVRGLPELDREQQHDLLSALMSSQGVYEELTLLDSQGQEAVRLARREIISIDKHVNRAGADEFEKPKASGDTYYSSVHFDEDSGEPVMTIAISIFEIQSGDFVGVLVANFRFTAVWELMANAQQTGAGTVYIVDAQNRVVAHRDPSIVLQGTYFDPPEHDGFYSGLDGTPVALVVNHIQLGEQVFDVVAEKPASEALSLAINAVVVTVIAIVITLVTAGGLSLLIARRIVRPINALATTAQAIRAGDLSHQVEVTHQDEIGVLADAFNQMLVRLRRTLQNEREQREHLQSTIATYVEHMSQVAHGNLSGRIELEENGHSVEDDPLLVLGHNLNETTSSLRRMIKRQHDTASNLSAAVSEILAATKQQASGANEHSAAASQTSTNVDEVKAISQEVITRLQELADRHSTAHRGGVARRTACGARHH